MQKSLVVHGLKQPVTLARRKGTRHLRLSVKSDGSVRVSVPFGVSEKVAHDFIAAKLDWIQKHEKSAITLTNGCHIGKSHRLYFKQAYQQKVTTRVKTTEIIVNVPSELHNADQSVQKAAKKAAERALKTQAERLLPQRLKTIAKQCGISYKSCTVKKLRSRWGSCDQDSNIVLNIYLMQLEWSLIDYVIKHELAHTKHKHHQATFWQYMSTLEPNYKLLRKQLKQHPTDVIPTAYS